MTDKIKKFFQDNPKAEKCWEHEDGVLKSQQEASDAWTKYHNSKVKEVHDRPGKAKAEANNNVNQQQ
jgi:hypothetical protein